MSTIAILGANSQVGSEVSLLLSQMEGISVVPIVRTKLGASLLARCGLECRVGSILDAAVAPALLGGVDLVADFSIPRGQPAVTWKLAKENIEAAFRHSPAQVPYLYVSSTMAFGMDASDSRYAHRTISRSAYASFKRRAERLAERQGRLHRRPVYIFRLGQVHGELQQVSRYWKLLVTSEPVSVAGAGDIPCDTVFCSTIAGALADLLGGHDPPGHYTVLENPDWTWKQMWEFYGRQRGIDVEVLGRDASAPGKAGIAQAFAGVVRVALGSLKSRKDFLMAHIPLSQQMEYRLKLRYLSGRATEEIAEAQRSVVELPHFLQGPVPGRRLTKSPAADARNLSAARRVRSILDERLRPEGHNFEADAISGDG